MLVEAKVFSHYGPSIAQLIDYDYYDNVLLITVMTVVVDVLWVGAYMQYKHKKLFITLVDEARSLFNRKCTVNMRSVMDAKKTVPMGIVQLTKVYCQKNYKVDGSLRGYNC